MKKNVRILHISDLHLSKDKEVTLQALQDILATGRNLNIDLLTIGGDVFDSEGDAESLRSQLRDTFRNTGFTIVIIPGNHDKDAYLRNVDFGPDLKVATGNPFSVFTFDDTALVALPYRDAPDERLYSELRNAAKDARTRILLLHCTLDLGLAALSFGEEEVKSYFPITRETLSRLGYNFILAGHFHTEPYRVPLDGSCQFLYPGSPVSLTRKEIGRRSGWLVDTESKSIQSVLFDTFYYDELKVEVVPGFEKEAVKQIREWLSDKSTHNCSLEIDIVGFIQVPEIEFRQMLGEFSNNIDVHYRYKDVQHILAHPLFRRFKEKLEANASIQEKDHIERIVLDVFSVLLADRKLRE